MSAQVSQFESAHGALVPRDPNQPPDRLTQERQEERINAPRLLKYLNKTLDAIASLDQNENLKIHNEMTRCVAYYDGRWDGEVRNGEWVDNQVITGEILPKDNEYKKQIDKLQMEMCRNRIEYHPEASNKFSAEMREAANFAERRIEINQDRIETEPFIQGENMSLLLKTTAFRYTFFDPNAESQEKSVELSVVRQLTEGKSHTVCRTCGISAHPAKPVAKTVADIAYDPQQADDYEESRKAGYEATKVAGWNCPNCGDTETREIESPGSEGMQTEQKSRPAGRVVTVRPDATMVQIDLNGRDIESSSFIRWRLVLRRCDWEAFFPNTKIPSSVESTEGRHRSEAQNQASNSGWNVSSDDAGGGQFEKIEGELVWLDPKVYQRYENKENETLGDGRTLPAGTKLSVDQYPSGCCVARIAQTVLDIFPSNKNKCWTKVVYGLREHAQHGSGTVALLGPQDTINDENAFIVGHHYQFASGRDFMRSGAVQGGQMPGINQVGIVEGAPPEVNDVAAWAVGHTQPEGLSGDVYGFRDAMRSSLQDAAGTSSLSMQGAADAKQLGTATGVEASRDQAVGRLIPNRKLQAFAGAEWIKQVLELERENYTAETFLGMADRCDEKGEVEYTERGVRAFFNSDVRNDFIVKPVDGSWMPTTPQQERANAAGFAQAAAQVKGDKQMLSIIAPAFNQDFSVDEWGAAQRNASMRIEEYARVSKIVSGGGFPASEEMVQVVLANTAEWARVNPSMDQHEAFRDFYQDWWLSDEGRNADTLLRMVVQTVHDLHLSKGVVGQAQEMGAAQLASQAPQMAAQEQMAAQQKQQADAEAAQAGEQGKQEMVAQALGEHALKQDDREHEAQVEMQKKEHDALIQSQLKEHSAVVDAAAQLERGTAN
jgi:hypothetical protein